MQSLTLYHHSPLKILKKAKIMAYRKKLKQYYGILTNEAFIIYKPTGNAQSALMTQIRAVESAGDLASDLLLKLMDSMKNYALKVLHVRDISRIVRQELASGQKAQAMDKCTFVIVTETQAPDASMTQMKHVFTADNEKMRNEWMGQLEKVMELEKERQRAIQRDAEEQMRIREEKQKEERQQRRTRAPSVRESAAPAPVATLRVETPLEPVLESAASSVNSPTEQHPISPTPQPNLSEIPTDGFTDITSTQAGFTEDMNDHELGDSDDDDEITFAAEADNDARPHGVQSHASQRAAAKQFSIILNSAQNPNMRRIENWTHQAFICFELGRRLFFKQSVQTESDLNQLFMSAHELMVKKLSQSTIDKYANSEEYSKNLPRLFLEIPKLNEYIEQSKHHECRNRSDWVQHVKSNMDSAQSSHSCLGLLICDGPVIWAVFCIENMFVNFAAPDWASPHTTVQSATLKYCGTGLSAFMEDLKTRIKTKKTVTVTHISPMLSVEEYKAFLQSKKLEQIKQNIKGHKSDISLLLLNQKDVEKDMKRLEEDMGFREVKQSEALQQLEAQLADLNRALDELRTQSADTTKQDQRMEMMMNDKNAAMQSSLDEQLSKQEAEIRQLHASIEQFIRLNHASDQRHNKKLGEMESALRSEWSTNLSQQVDQLRAELRKRDERIALLESTVNTLATQMQSTQSRLDNQQQLEESVDALLDNRLNDFKARMDQSFQERLNEIVQNFDVQRVSLSEQFLELNVQQRLLRAKQESLKHEKESSVKTRFDKLLSEVDAASPLKGTAQKLTMTTPLSSTKSTPLPSSTPRKFASTHFESFVNRRDDPFSKDLFIPPSPLRKESNDYISSLYGGYVPKFSGSRT